MTFAQILAFFGPFAAVLKPELLTLENTAMTDLKALIASKVSSPDLQALLIAVEGGLDAFAQIELNKLKSPSKLSTQST